MDLTLEIYLLVACLLWVGYLNWNLATKNSELEEQVEVQHNLILSMAKELKEFGSPNVSIAEPEPTFNITYGNKE